ncbi:MAG: methionyl-tRNA formyltransferase [Bifidobacteriaceae bacterium]|jgi:methionyl-tRNA formyltransferase|nr:methionyl-tRNA formyltransferase [Bifidobacteriaceae bacterium]
MRLVFAGTPQAALPSLEKLAANFDVKAVLTRPPARQGRSKKLIKSPVHLLAESLNIEVITQNPNTCEVKTKLQALNLDAIAVVAYGYILKKSILEVSKYGWFNLHFSLLPQFRGAAPVENAIFYGCNKTGITIFKIDEGMDTGQIACQKEYKLDSTETAGGLLDKLSRVGSKELLIFFQKLNKGKITFVKQQGKSSLAPKLDGVNSYINWADTAVNISQKIRSFNPQPKAKTNLKLSNNKQLNLFILYAEQISNNNIPQFVKDYLLENNNLPVGSIISSKKRLFIKCGVGFLEVLQLQVESRNVVGIRDFLNGFRIDKQAYFI